MNNYRMPNGEYTESFEEYSNAWKVLYTPLMEATGTIMHSYDSRVTLRAKENFYNNNVELPVWFLEAFNASRKE